MVRQLRTDMLKNETEPLPLYTKINSCWVKDIHTKNKPIKFLEDKIGGLEEFSL